jgi:5-methylcytosine-specific restriction endonuclease McrA
MTINYEDYQIHVKKSGQKLKKYKCSCDSCGEDRGYLPKAKAFTVCHLCKVKQPEYKAKLSMAIRAVRSTEESRQKTKNQILKQKELGWIPAIVNMPMTMERRIAHSCGARKISISRFDGFVYNSVEHRIAKNFRKALRKCRQSKISIKTDDFLSKYLGYTLKDLKSHLESRFLPGMSWDNYGEWHIDHIIPLKYKKENGQYYWLPSSMKDINSEEFKSAWSLNNLQPLWAKDNIKKGNSFIG